MSTQEWIAFGELILVVSFTAGMCWLVIEPSLANRKKKKEGALEDK